jgi:hypothetical protein
MSKETIYELVDNLPANNMTVRVLQALDFVIPGEWQNLVGFERTIKVVSGESDQEMIQNIGDRAIKLYNDKSQGYQRAMWLYQTVEKTDRALALAVLGDKVGEKIGLLSFLSKITPRADTSQAIDLSMKLVVELLAFCQISGIPGDSIGDFVKALSDYSGESLMRMVALICIDGIIPLGPDFVSKALETLQKSDPSDLERNDTFEKVRPYIPGDGTAEQKGFIQQSLTSVQDWINGFIHEHNLTAEKIVSNLQNFVAFSDDKLDYLGAFLDMTTNYYEHTGTQTLARRLIERAVNEI